MYGEKPNWVHSKGASDASPPPPTCIVETVLQCTSFFYTIQDLFCIELPVQHLAQGVGQCSLPTLVVGDLSKAS